MTLRFLEVSDPLRLDDGFVAFPLDEPEWEFAALRSLYLLFFTPHPRITFTGGGGRTFTVVRQNSESVITIQRNQQGMATP